MTPEEKKTKMCFDPRLNASEKDIPWDNFSLPGNLSSYVHLKFTFQKAFELYFKLIRTAFYLLLWRIGFKDEHHVIFYWALQLNCAWNLLSLNSCTLQLCCQVFTSGKPQITSVSRFSEAYAFSNRADT